MVRGINYKFWKNKRVLITGHSGFKGSWMTSWLLKLGANIRGLSLPIDKTNYLFNKIKNSIDSEVDSVYGNILDRSFLKKSINEFQPEIIFHFAAQSLVLESYSDPIKTWETNLLGTLNLLISLKEIKNNCSLVIITTDKVYKNKEWIHGYRENDELGGFDPYSASKAACEIAVSSWRSSFSENEEFYKYKINIATARAGNVIGGGDWAANRIVPDIIKSLISSKKVIIRNPNSQRPWQHVLEPLEGYILLAETITLKGKNYCQSYNFGPNPSSNKTVRELVEKVFTIWPGDWINENNKEKVHESRLLKLQIEKSYQFLNWEPKWNFDKTITKTVEWYKNVHHGSDPFQEVMKNIINYEINNE